MKRSGILTVFVLGLLHLNVIAQPDANQLTDSLFTKYLKESLLPGPHNGFYIIESGRSELQMLQVIRSLSEDVHIIKVDNHQQAEKIKKYHYGKANNEWKNSPALQRNQHKQGQQKFIISAINIEELMVQLRLLQKTADVKILASDMATSSVVVSGKFVDVHHLINSDNIIFFDWQPPAHSETKVPGYDRSYHGINVIDFSMPQVNGNNIIVGVKEQTPNVTDIDLQKRITTSSIAAPNVTEHATVIATLIGGAGNSFYDGRGLAWACTFFPSSFDNLFPDQASILTSNKVSVQNHSYGTIVQQFYGAEAASYDAQLWANKNLLHVFSAGNAGTNAANEGKYAGMNGFANLTANFKMAKNVITVGALDRFGNVAALSSAGPLYDGRIAPQITAHGPGGTSDAAAIVTGTVALMQQVYADSNNQQLPAASLLKAVLYNTAEDIYTEGIDYKTGYGLLNSRKAIRSLQQKEYAAGEISANNSWTKTIHVPANSARLKVTLSWTDSNATINNNKALINDLDLEVEDIISQVVYQPWVLSTEANQNLLAAKPVRKRDSLNTAELVSIDQPGEGDYKIVVKTAQLINNSIPFNIAFHCDTLNRFVFINPQHASDVLRDERDTLIIKWETHVTSAQETGSLAISYDRGINWVTIQPAIPLALQQHEWLIKDTASTALLRMQTSFGNFFSNEFNLSPLTKLKLDFNCTDSFALSWNKHLYAAAYEMFALADSPYLKLIKTISDTFLVFNRTNFPYKTFAVKPVLTNGIEAARSRIINTDLQSIQCFYSSFYHVLLDENELDLVIDLSAPAYVDSLLFQQVASNGNILRSVGQLKVTPAINIYHQLAQNLPAGTSYWRVQIRLRTGGSLSSEIIAVHTTGKRYIQFYPNPTRRSNYLSYVLRQGIGSDAMLQLFDMTGKLLKNYVEMPGSISTGSFPAGVLIYKLFDAEGQLLETGKILVN